MALVKMFFNGCQPLVERCDGNDTSFRSTPLSPRARHEGREGRYEAGLKGRSLEVGPF